jgi:hypothetical protein
MQSRAVPLHLLALGILLVACAKEVPVVAVQGECGDAYKGNVCTWAQMKGDSLIEVGATVPLASIENAPNEEAMVWPPKSLATLQIPAAAAQKSGFDHLTMYWEPMGHPPGPYLTPHFDFHFNMISSADRTAIDCSDAGKPAALPTGYGIVDVPLPPPMAAMTGTNTLVGLCVPQMGMHSLLNTELQSKDPFRGSMVIGYYHQKPIFIEPMLTRTMLMEKRSFTLPIPNLPGASGVYPHEFRAVYDSTKQAYSFTFSSFASGT